MKRHTLYIRSLASVLFLTGSLFFTTACSDDEMFESDNTLATGEGISFGATINSNTWEPDTRSSSERSQNFVIEGDGMSITATIVDGIEMKRTEQQPQSRGAQVTAASSVQAFDVAAFFSETSQHFFTEKVNNGVNTAGNTYYWPQEDKLDFIATYPQGALTLPTDNYSADDLSFTYTIQNDVAKQQDVMVAWPKDINNGATGTVVPLQFQHLLAAVQFKVGEMQFIKINSLKVVGVNGGEVTFTYNNGSWTPTATTSSEYDLSSVIVDTSALIQGEEITGNANNSMLLVAPQKLPAEAKIVISYTETITGLTYNKEAALSGEWVAGKTTVYALNIAGTNFGTVEIPRPDDQDAHYIMLHMTYNMGTILNSDKIQSVKATAQWKKDENGNDISDNSSTKSGISLKFASELSETQKQGFWTDKRYIETIEVSNTGESNSSGLIEDTTPDSYGNTGLRGGSFLNITNAKGEIVLFIEENNGTTDREGELLFTATLTTGSDIILGRGQFKQLCPSWNKADIGVERIETDNATYAFGFDYTRKVEYVNPGNSWRIFKDVGRLLYTWGAYSLISDDEGSFITLDKGSVNVDLGFWEFTLEYINSVTLDYGALNEVQEVANSEDGKDNTRALYNYTGGVDIGQIETDFDDNLNWEKLTPEEGEGTPEDYAAFIALSRNRMYEKKTVVHSSQEDIITYKAVLYKDGATALEGDDIIEWYLPSSVEAQNLVETGTDSDGETSTVIDNLNGTYWSSTAGDDMTPAKSYTFTYSENTYQNVNETKRTEKHKVRAVRKKP